MLVAAGTGEPEAYTRQRMSGSAAPDGVLAGDRQYLLLLDDTGTLLASALWGRRDDRTWLYSGPIDLTRYAGKPLRIQFGVYNDGDGRSSAMFVDDVALQIYWQSSPILTRTPGATPSPVSQATATPALARRADRTCTCRQCLPPIRCHHFTDPHDYGYARTQRRPLHRCLPLWGIYR